MVNRGFRPSIGRVQNSSKIFNGQKTNATIRDLEEEEDELEEREGSIVSIETDKINGAGWTVKDTQGETHICSCATSMYEIPNGKTRGGKLYPSETIQVKFTINPVLRLNSITEILSSGKESEKLDVTDWIHEDEATTVIAKPDSAMSISNGFIQMNYSNKNQIITGKYGISTEGENTDINTDTTSINSDSITVYDGQELDSYINNQALSVSNEFESYNIGGFDNLNIHLDRSNNITQLDINTVDSKFNRYGVIGEIKDQKAIPIRKQSQQLVTDGDCMDIVTIDEDGIIYIKSYENDCPAERIISSTHNWITPQVEARNYIKVIVNKRCNNCDEGINAQAEYINYCPSCNNWNILVNTSTSIKCNTCGMQYCQNCGANLSIPHGDKLKKYHENFISAIGSTCNYCKTQLHPNTNKQYVNYCPDCEQWGKLYQTERIDTDKEEEDELFIVNILKCESCEAEYCSTCGINQDKHGLTLTNNPVQYQAYKDALRKLKYIKDGV